MEDIIIKKEDINLIKTIIDSSVTYLNCYDFSSKEKDNVIKVLADTINELEYKEDEELGYIYEGLGVLISDIVFFLIKSNRKENVNLDDLKPILKTLNIKFEGE